MMLKPPGIALLAVALSGVFPINQRIVERSGALALRSACHRDAGCVSTRQCHRLVNGRITVVGPRERVAIPAGVRAIDCKG